MRTTRPWRIVSLAICALGMSGIAVDSVAHGNDGRIVELPRSHTRYCGSSCPDAHSKDAVGGAEAIKEPCMKDWFPPCGPPGRHWVRADYLGWWFRGAEAPPLITTSPEGTDLEDAGVIGVEGTEILFGGGRLNHGMHSGFRLRMGTWFDCHRKHGVEGSFFLLVPNRESASAGSGDGSQIVGRPFIDATTGQNIAELVDFPGLGGVVDARTRTSLLGAEVLFRHNMFCDPYCCYDPYSKPVAHHITDYKRRACVRQDLLVGFRYLNLSDRVTIRESLEVLDAGLFDDPSIAEGTQFDIEDRFRTTNDFYGLKLGFDYLRHHGRWSLEARPQVSLGVMDRNVSISGETRVTNVDGSEVLYPAGLLALSSNIGHYRSSQWTLVPELDLSVGYLIRPRTRLLVGYSCLYLPGVAWAGQQIDPVVNPELIPPEVPGAEPERPAYLARWDSAWVQGVTAGLEHRW